MAKNFLYDYELGWNIKCAELYRARISNIHLMHRQKGAIELVESFLQAEHSWHKAIVTSIGQLCGCFQQLDSGQNLVPQSQSPHCWNTESDSLHNRIGTVIGLVCLVKLIHHCVFNQWRGTPHITHVWPRTWYLHISNMEILRNICSQKTTEGFRFIC